MNAVKGIGVPTEIRTTEERAYGVLCEAAKDGTPTRLPIRLLVLAVKSAVEWGCVTTARYGLDELQERMSDETERRAA